MKYIVYTDASYKKGNAGAGWVTCDAEGQPLSENFASLANRAKDNNVAEIMAAIEALQDLPAGSDVILYTDSASLVNITERLNGKTPIRVTCGVPLWLTCVLWETTLRHSQVSIEKVGDLEPGRTHNKRADALARRARVASLGAAA